MRFEDKLRKYTHEEIWKEYCGFLDISLSDYMYIQKSLMKEQIGLWSASGLGKKLLDGKKPDRTRLIESFREELPLTTYENYAEDLLNRRSDMLCSEPAIWIQTTWEGGLRPIKLAPYTRSMLDIYRHNLIATLLMGSASKKGDINVKRGDRVLYGGAPLPYATGIMPSLLDEDIHLTWLPDTNEHSGLSFSQRIKKGFAMALSGGVDYFFGIGSVANYITENFGKSTGHSGKLNISIGNAFRYAKAKYVSRRDGRPIVPGDIFRLKAFFFAGTDTHCYRDRLHAAWGVCPLESAAGTESTVLGAETWEHNGMVLFPDSCFYEFIPALERERNREDPTYQPRTVLMDQVRTGHEYEIVISVLHGGAFMRYRIGDIYRCVSAGNNALPRFTFVDRTPEVIDIAGFTRITENSMKEVVRMSGLHLGEWVLRKEFNEKEDPFLHLYVEIPPDAQASEITARAVLTEHLALYFKYFDSDYGDLKKLLNMEPLLVTPLRFGTIAAYEQKIGKHLVRINPPFLDVEGMLKQEQGYRPASERTCL